MCCRYGQRPSAVIGLTDPAIALDFDMAMAAIHRFEQQSKIHSVAAENPIGALVIASVLS